MSEQLKVGDWVTVTSVGYYFGSRRQYTCRVAKVLPSGSLKLAGQFSERSFKPPRPGAPTYRANAELWLQPATPAEVAQAEAEDAKEKADAEAALIRNKRARAWLAAYDWDKCPGMMPIRIAEDLGWKGEG